MRNKASAMPLHKSLVNLAVYHRCWTAKGSAIAHWGTFSEQLMLMLAAHIFSERCETFYQKRLKPVKDLHKILQMKILIYSSLAPNWHSTDFFWTPFLILWHSDQNLISKYKIRQSYKLWKWNFPTTFSAEVKNTWVSS